MWCWTQAPAALHFNNSRKHDAFHYCARNSAISQGYEALHAANLNKDTRVARW